MSAFKGFSSTHEESIPIQQVFFTDLLPELTDQDELRAVLFVFWYLDGLDTEPGYVDLADLLKDERLAGCFGATKDEQEKRLTRALEGASEHEILLRAELDGQAYYFLNSQRGRAARDGLLDNQWHPGDEGHTPLTLQPQRPNIFALYEQNIGPLTPLMSETLQDAEKDYPADWIEEAVRLAVEKNARNWRYVEAILRSWKEKGRDGTDRKTAEENRKRDSEGKYADYINR